MGEELLNGGGAFSGLVFLPLDTTCILSVHILIRIYLVHTLYILTYLHTYVATLARLIGLMDGNGMETKTLRCCLSHLWEFFGIFEYTSCLE